MRIFLSILALLIASVSSEAQALKKASNEALEKGAKFFGKELIGSSDEIVQQTFKSNAAKSILKKFDDDAMERLGALLSANPKMKKLLSSNNTALRMYLMMGNTSASKNVHVVKYFSDILDEVGEKGFKNKFNFQQSGDLLLIKGKNGRHIASVNDNIIEAKPWKGAKDLNPLLHQYKMIPNATYKINGHFYKTLADGRYKEITGTIIKLPEDKAVRNVEAQGLSKKVKNAIPEVENGEVKMVAAGYPVYKDDGGHILANMFGGGSEMYNYLPMSKKLNRQGGKWAQMEKKWEKALRQGKKVEYKIIPIYDGATNRPDKFRVTYVIDGKRETELFDNNVF